MDYYCLQIFQRLLPVWSFLPTLSDYLLDLEMELLRSAEKSFIQFYSNLSAAYLYSLDFGSTAVYSPNCLVQPLC